jgi:hypothetical protein
MCALPIIARVKSGHVKQNEQASMLVSVTRLALA